jgi:hypothetical protein
MFKTFGQIEEQVRRSGRKWLEMRLDGSVSNWE